MQARSARAIVVVVVAMGSFAVASPACRDHRPNRYGPELPYEAAVTTVTMGVGGGPPTSASIAFSISPPTSASNAASCVVPATPRPRFPPTINPATIPPRPNPAQRPKG